MALKSLTVATDLVHTDLGLNFFDDEIIEETSIHKDFIFMSKHTNFSQQKLQGTED